MAKFDIKELNYITADKKLNTFNISYCYTDDGNIAYDVKRPSVMSVLLTRTFFGNIGEFNSMSLSYASNQQCLYDISNDMIIRNMYDITKTLLLTTAKMPHSAKLQNIYVPRISDDVISFCLFKNYAYGLTKPYTETPMYDHIKNNLFISNQDYSYINVISSDLTHTHLYPKPSEVKNEHYDTYRLLIDNNATLSNAIISSIFSTKRNLKNIEYNYILELQESLKYNDYENGSIQCDCVVTKNHMNYLYDMQISAMNETNKARCLMLQIDELHSGMTGQIALMQFIDNDASPFLMPRNYSATIVSENCLPMKESENVTKMLDGKLTTKWCFTCTSFPVKVKIDLKSNCFDILKYSRWQIYNANDAESYPLRQLKSFSLSYSIDGLTFKALDLQVNVVFPVDNYALAYLNIYEKLANAFGLINCRDYCNLNVCGDKLFATYRTNVNYIAKDAYVRYIYPTNETLIDLTALAILEYDMHKERTDYGYQHVEIIESISRYDSDANGAGHKSSMFSLMLTDTGLNESTISLVVKDKLRQNIQNNIRDILDTVIPANTLLFNIYFEGK